jgi:hypothetical protein
MLAVVFLMATGNAAVAQSFAYPEAKHGQGELRYINGIPVLVVAGTPEEIGEQMGVLAMKPAAKGVHLVEDLLKEQGIGYLKPLLARLGDSLLAKFPQDYRTEMEAAAKASGIRRELLVIANTMHDIRRLTGCSTLLVDPARSATGAPLVGRNLDFSFVNGTHQYSLVVVYRPKGKRPFAAVSFPGATVVGCAMSAMNADGLVFGQNDVGKAADNSRSVELGNTPTAVIARRVLEECSTVAEAEQLIRSIKPAGRSIFFACDKDGGAIFEVTPNTVVVRRDPGVCPATNKFETKELAVSTSCKRAAILAKAREVATFDIAEVAKTMHRVHQGKRTAHTVVFEPRNLTMHVAFGDGEQSATAFPLHEVRLAELLRR